MTIEEFIEARLAEDERIARAAGDGTQARWAYEEWSPGGLAGGEVYRPDTLHPKYGDVHYVTMDSEGLSPAVDPPEGTHIARHDPARVLRQVVAIRGVLESVKALDAALSGGEHHGLTSYTYGALEDLAEIWSDHPDYQQEWAA